MQYLRNEKNKAILHWLVAPFIWLPFPFMLLFHLLVEIYQFICFPAYGLEKVKRSEYILILDRNKLAYLTPSEKVGCMYCGYMNGVLRYIKEIAGRTEKYWCGIMHENKPGFKKQEDQIKQKFAKFGDEKDFKKKYNK